MRHALPIHPFFLKQTQLQSLGRLTIKSCIIIDQVLLLQSKLKFAVVSFYTLLLLSVLCMTPILLRLGDWRPMYLKTLHPTKEISAVRLE